MSHRHEAKSGEASGFMELWLAAGVASQQMSVQLRIGDFAVKTCFVLLVAVALASPALLDVALADPDGGASLAMLSGELKALYFGAAALVGMAALRRAA